ncbi:MAG: glutamine synthetase family protein [Calothrix sp. MO_167.B42]|nr:glutamine synthetase family protein [Calothrix sp. MO_167.B42]
MNDQFFSSLEQNNIRFVRILWCDNGNVIRAKAVHRSRLSHYLTYGVGIAQAQQAVPVMMDAPVAGTGLGPVGEVRLVPDWTTITPLPYAIGHARVMGDMIREGQPWSFCPRFFLKRMIAEAARENLEIQAAFENEFYLLKPSTTEIIPADETVFAASLSMDLQQPVIDAIAEALTAQGIVVEQYYPESGPGQQEISILYQPALTAADQQIAFRETVKAVAHQHHLQASFLPKIFPNQAGSGTHIHWSLWQDGKNIIPTQQGQLSPTACQFMAGILDHLPALMALTTPSPNSYRRLQPQSWSGAFRCWGYDNREAAIRVPTNPNLPSPTHVELKTVDASANPYLALGGIIAAGLDGVRRSLSLPEAVVVDPQTLTDSQRSSQQIDRLPSSLGESIQQLQQDRTLLSALGPDLGTAYLAVRQAEYQAMKEWSLEQEVKLLINRY